MLAVTSPSRASLAPTLDLCWPSGAGLLLFQQPLAITRRELRHFIRLSRVHCLQNLQFLALACKDPGIALAVHLQPHVVIAAAHRRAIARQAKGISIGTRQSGNLAIGLELHGIA